MHHQVNHLILIVFSNWQYLRRTVKRLKQCIFSQQWLYRPERLRIISIFSSLLIYFLLGLSVVLLFIPEDTFFRNLMVVVSIINIGLAYFYLFQKKNIYLFAVQISFALLSFAVLIYLI